MNIDHLISTIIKVDAWRFFLEFPDLWNHEVRKYLTSEEQIMFWDSVYPRPRKAAPGKRCGCEFPLKNHYCKRFMPLYNYLIHEKGWDVEESDMDNGKLKMNMHDKILIFRERWIDHVEIKLQNRAEGMQWIYINPPTKKIIEWLNSVRDYSPADNFSFQPTQKKLKLESE